MPGALIIDFKECIIVANLFPVGFVVCFRVLVVDFQHLFTEPTGGIYRTPVYIYIYILCVGEKGLS